MGPLVKRKQFFKMAQINVAIDHLPLETFRASLDAEMQ